MLPVQCTMSIVHAFMSKEVLITFTFSPILVLLVATCNVMSRLSDDNIAFVVSSFPMMFEFVVLELDHVLCTPCSPFLIHHYGKGGMKTFVGGLNLQTRIYFLSLVDAQTRLFLV